ncbi:MAG: DUF58 domain-containing protein [Phycisphaerae bacterium]|nr:DUF58 domain-containing protein [Phycisphaerae bacterium]
MARSRKYLDPETVARLKGLELRARAIAAGVRSGLHRSAYRGYSVEFAEHRQYVPGDDTRHIDWRLFGRKDRLYIKQYEEESNLSCQLLIDVSHSMVYGSGPLTKHAYAACLAGGLAWLLVNQQDTVGLITFDREIRATLPSGSGKGHLDALLTLLEDSSPAEHTDVKVLLHRLAAEMRRRAIVVLISDLLTPPEELIAGLEHLAHAGHEIVVMHVLDDDEWHLPFHENVLFEGLEEDESLLVDPQSLRAGYLRAVERFVTGVRATCLKLGADYVPVNTHEPLDGVLSGYLSWRARGKAGRR